MSVLDKLYEQYEGRTVIRPKQQDAEEQFGEVWKRVEKVLGEDRAEELRSSIFDYMEEECRQDFQAGFRLGALLMLELQSPAAP